MNVVEAIARLGEMSQTSVLVARPPLTWGSDALFVELTSDYRVPQTIKDDGYEYLLGREDIENLVKSLSRKKISAQAVAEFIIHYAMADSPPAWIDDIADV